MALRIRVEPNNHINKIDNKIIINKYKNLKTKDDYKASSMILNVIKLL